jgi:Protein of unknown function (DUF2809)
VPVEVGRLYHALWLDSIRGTMPGGLVVGSDFVRSDPACYPVGVGLCIVIGWASLHERSAPGK